MADDESGSDDSELHELQVHLLPLPKKKSQTTSFAKCITRQLDSEDKLRKGKESFVAKLISKLKIRQHDVYQRLPPDLDLSHENEVLYEVHEYSKYQICFKQSFSSGGGRYQRGVNETFS